MTSPEKILFKENINWIKEELSNLFQNERQLNLKN